MDAAKPQAAFLTARWTHLCLVTYAVPPAVLQPRLPPGLELDLRDGLAFVSLVAFNFLDTRVLGVAWPGYRNFAELNLRYYVRHQGERGVVFIREFVPQRLVAGLARWIYNEPYRAAPLTHAVEETPDRITATCRLTWAGRQHTLSVVARKPTVLPGTDSVEHFFKEHSWGFGTDRRGRLIRYHVEHPCWEVHPVEAHRLAFDWAAVYGPEWQFLEDKAPCSVVLAAGSAVKVFPKGRH